MKLNPPQVLSQDDLRVIHEASLRILAEVGLRVEGDEMSRLLAEAGADVDSTGGRVRIPAELASRALRAVPSQVALWDRTGRTAIQLGDGRTHVAVGCDAIFFQDVPRGERRPATKEEVGNLCRIADALDLYSVVSPPAIPQDATPQSSYAHAVDAAFNNTSKHLLLVPETAEVARNILRMVGEVAGTDALANRPIITCLVSIPSPLQWPQHLCDNTLTLIRAGIPVIFHCAPLVGASAPITLAGLLAQQNAEVLSGIIISQVVRPGTPVIYGGGWGTFDLRSMTRVLGSPEGALLRIAGGQLGRFYHIPTHSLGPDSDAQVHDEQAGWEKMLSAVVALSAGIGLVVNSSMYGTGMTVSYEQLVIDHEILSMAYRLLDGITINSDTLALDVIKSVCPDGSFLTEEHTLRHLRSGEHWRPAISNRRSYDQWNQEGAKDVVQRAGERARAILAAHRPLPLEPSKCRALKGIISALEAVA